MNHISNRRHEGFRETFCQRWLPLVLCLLGLGIACLDAGAQISLPAVGDISTIAGNHHYGYSGDGGLATSAKLKNPSAIAVDDSGNVYFVDAYANVLRKVTASSGIITRIAGSSSGAGGYSGNGGLATSAKLQYPVGVALDSAGNLYIADSGNNVIRKVTVSTGIITTIAGIGGTADYYGDGGPATSAALSDPEAVAFDSAGNLYIADTGNNVIREVNTGTGVINTVAGNGVANYSGDGGQATAAELNGPNGVEIDASGDMYISDSVNNRIREVTSSTGVINTIAGNGSAGYTGDGGQATSAEMNLPLFIALDSADNVYIADYNNNVIRMVTTSTGVISTIAGTGAYGYSGDGGSATSATMNGPVGVTVDTSGHVYITDWNNYVVRAVTLSSPIAVSVSPTSATLYASQTQQFTATVTNTQNTAVTWSISPAGVGTISSSGLYTAPATISSQQTVTITATSQADNAALATGTVTLAPSIEVGVSPSSAILYASQIQQFTATVTNTQNTAVTWSISPAGTGTISASGLYTAPSAISAQQTITITATSEANPSATATSTVTLYPPVSVNVTPGTAALYANQTQQFSATVANTSDTSVTWAVSPSGSGSITASGLYTAPTAIASQQSVTITATSQADSSKSATATITLFPTLQVTVTPTTGSIYSGQTQQFAASVTNAVNTSVTWSVSPSDTGYITAAGVYAAPVGISTQQTVIITATSQADPTRSASASLILLPTCNSNGFSYERTVIIDHTRVVNSDQTDFPILVSTTDPLLANAASGGHVQNSNGYDIIFTSDAAGRIPLDFEIDSYNSATGAVAFWIRIPTLSHSTDTTIFMWYGNAAITASQENKAGVWRNGYAGVWHFGQPGTLSTADSTSNANNATNQGVVDGTGVIGGAGSFDGTGNTYFDIPSSNSYKPTSAITLEAWVNPASTGLYPNIFSLDYAANGTWNGPYHAQAYSLGYFFLSLQPLFQVTNNDTLDRIFPDTGLAGGQWAHIVGTYDGSNMVVYVNGSPVATMQQTGPITYGTSKDLAIGAQSPYVAGGGLNGLIDEARLSTVSRSADWIATEYNNQSSPSTFVAISAEDNGTLTVPTAVSLYAGQYQQFAATGVCDPGTVLWSMPAGSPGTLTSSGLYVAPSSITSQQAITITATTIGALSQSYSATVTLEPPVTVTVSPASATLYGGQTQQLTALVGNAPNTAVTWTIGPGGAGSITSSGLYTAPSNISAAQTVTITATTQQVPSQSASASITLLPPVSNPVGISLTPSSSTLNAGQTQQFTATVTNTTNTGVNWTISPAGTGAIDGTGLYTAPTTVTSQQTVTITATSQADTTQSASALVTLSPNGCAANGYGYERTIVIDHTKVPNSDQVNFPVLFNTTDPLFATTTNGGHVTSSSGYDIIFSTDPNGLTPLDYELEQYNPATGQVIAWIRVPDLSHTADTVIYMFYGNSAVTASQQNPQGVWGNNYVAVYHLANGSTLSLSNSVNTSNSLTNNGVTPTTGQIDGAASFNGSQYAYTTSPSELPTGTSARTLSTWFQMSANTGEDLVGWGDNSGNGDRWALTWNGSQIGVEGENVGASANMTYDNNWHYLVATSPDGNDSFANVNIYVDGVLQTSSGSGSINTTGASLALGTIPGALGIGNFQGSLDEVRVSSIDRSADWVATEYNNQSSPSTFYSLNPENAIELAPSAVNLYGGQSQQFAATGVCSSSVSWSLSSNAPGSLSASGLYTAPSTITSQETVTVTAASQGNSSNAGSATITLLPPVAVNLTPVSATLTQNQTQQFTATASNSNEGVIWTLSPSGAGTISSDGVYQAPALITTQETVTITATSQQDNTKSASAMITLSPVECASSGYGYQRVIIIDHTKVSNTDQSNFPLLFNTTDPDLASTANGGHVTSSSGYDIIFSTDPSGASKLDDEIEQYNPTTGQLVAWIRIPTLSHSVDTVLYMFYGNPNVIASQQNPSGVWDSNFEAVYHLGSLGANSAADSTSYANNASDAALTPSTGSIDGGASLNGTSSYLQIPNAAFPNFPSGSYVGSGNPNGAATTPFTATVGMWFRTAAPGGLFGQTAALACHGLLVCPPGPPTVPGDYDVPGGPAFYVGDNGTLVGPWGTTSKAYNDNQWHQATVTFTNDGTDTLYVDGQVAAVAQQQIPAGYDSSYTYFVGSTETILDSQGQGNFNWMFLNGGLDEVRVSDIARSGDWIQTEYNNQSSPSTFYSLYPVTATGVAPSAISLYPSQAQQFTVTATCSSAVSWTMPSGSPGGLSSTGLYTAPNQVSAQQSVTITAASQQTGTTLGSAVVTLQPSPAPITLAAQNQPPYGISSTQAFEATLLDPSGSPEPGIAVTFTITGANASIGSATTDASGVAAYSYTGANSGNDTIVATAIVNGNPVTSNTVTASWVTTTSNPNGTISLVASPALGRGGLAGAFTDGNGNVVEPVSIGATATEFIVPSGATQLQLGVNDSYYPDNGGTGFVVSVNGTSVTIPPTTMPWGWTSGALNNNYQYGLGDGTAPVIAAANLTAGQTITVAYQSGTVSADYPGKSPTGANGDPSWITGTSEWGGAYFPTLYTNAGAYPLGQPIPFSVVLVNGSGLPAANIPVTLTVSGANPGQYQATTDATGTAVFTYSGAYAGTDNLQAQATVAGNTLVSGEASVSWISYPAPTPAGSLNLSLFATNAQEQGYVVLATDASGNPVEHANVGFYLSGADNVEDSAETDSSGQAAFLFFHQNSGPFSIVAVDSVGRSVVVSAPYTNTWNTPGAGGSGNNAGIGVSISTASAVTLPAVLQLNGSVNDTISSNPVVQWTQVSGPGTATFANPQQATTTATFTDSGLYTLQLEASDSGTSSSAQVVVTVNPMPVSASDQGLIATPLNGSTVSGIVPITLASGVTLQSGTLVYFPASNITSVTTLNPNTTGSGQIGALDTTTLANGSYWIQMQSTDISGNSQWSLLLITVDGNYKPGRVTATVTDLVVPTTGLPISIQRQYDSLNASTSGDFGYSWNLATTVNLSVDPAGDVTFTLGGQRRTFYFAPQPLGGLFNVYLPAFTAEAGMYGFLTESGSGCPALDFVVPDGSSWQCDGGGQYSPPGYIYTDPTGTSYTITANGNLQSIVDRSGNTITVTPGGITSSTGLNVSFVRDSSGRITQITDPQGNQYVYTYDSNGNLASVTYPNTTQASTYTYDSAHHYTGGTDFDGNPLPTTTYYQSTVNSSGQCEGDCDPNGLPLNGRIESVQDALGETTSYAYNIETNTTTITYPPDATGAVGKATMVYDSYGDLLSSTDPLNNTTTNYYDANHNLISTKDPLGYITSYTYDQNGNRTSVTYPATGTSTNTTSYTQYNEFSEPTLTTDELGNVRTFNYDGNYNPQSVTDSIGTLASFLFSANGTMQAGAIGYDLSSSPANASQFTYDAYGNMTSRTDALGRTTSYTYNNLGQKVSMTIPLPNASTSSAAATTTYTYDPLGDLTQTAAPLGRTTSSTYDGNGNKISDTDARQNVTKYAYDALNRLITTTYPTQPGTTSTKSYDFRNNVIDAIDQDGHDTHYAYDLAGRLTSVTQAYGTSNAATTSYTYDNDGRKLTETDPLNHTTTYSYDNAGNLLSVSGPQGNFQYSYDNARNRISMTDGNGHTTQYVYDARKRLVQTLYPDGTKVANGYDGPGNLISVTDQANNVVQYTYDAANQLRSVVQLNSPNTGNNTNNYGFDNDGNLISLGDENGHTTQYSFDLFNDRISTTLPDGSVNESRTYDNNGNLLSVTHFSGMTTSYGYDPLNRLLSRTPDSRTGEATVSFTYTATGKRATMTDASGTTSYTYDSLDRLTQKATPEGTLNYTYDAAGDLATMASADGIVNVGYTWDTLNRLSTVTDNRLGGSSNTTTYTYDNASNVATATYPNGQQSTFNYDPENRLSSMTAGQAGYMYNLGPTGIRTGATEVTGRTLTWNFDPIYRLTGETVAGDAQYNGSVNYGLDPVGNRLSQSSSLHGISSLGFSYNADDQILGETYDSNGNTTATGGKTFAYDSENHLVSMNGGAVTLVYDGDGNRVVKTANSSTTRYLIDNLNPTGYSQVVEETVNGAAQREYTYGLQRIDEDQIVNSAWTPSFYGYDGFGTVRQLTSLTGAVTDTYEYDAYGNEITHTGTTSNDYLYRGEQYDSDLGMYYLRARYYNPMTGRFMSRDPNDGNIRIPASLHKYLYANGDPVNGIDPTGRIDLVEYDIRVNRFLRAAPALEEWGKELVDCLLALGAEVQELANPNDDQFREASTSEVGIQCGIFVFNSFRIVYSLTP